MTAASPAPPADDPARWKQLLRPLDLLRRKFSSDTRGEPIFPLGVLTALYFFDEFDTAAFSTLAPDIQRSFDLTDQEFLGLIILNVSVLVLLAVPMGYLGDRVSRTKIVVISGILAGSFSFVTGIATSVGVLLFARFGNGVGVLGNIPIHNSLLSDYYTPTARPTVFANHTNAMYLGAVAGPGVAGLVGAIFGWRAAFFVLFLPILITTFVAARLREPERGGTDPPGLVAPEHLPPPRFWPAVKTLWAIKTLRRLLWASIFFGAGLIPLAAYVSLYFERVFHLGPFERGLILAVNAAATFAGVQRGGRLTPAWMANGFDVPLKRMGAALALVGVGILIIAVSPWLALTVVVGLVTNFALGHLFAPLFATQAMVSPARERSLSFSFGAIFLVLGVVLFFSLGLGSVADDHGLRWALAVSAPFWVIGGAVASTAGRYVADDVAAAFA
jgi:MFS family permease